MNTKTKSRLKFFIPEARLLTEDEKAALPKDKKDAVSGKPGLWIEVLCPEGACSVEGDRITLPSGTAAETGGARGIWLNLFCPDNQCELRSYTDLP
ncbi:MAG: hypothetical protein RBR20_08295 [Desulfobacterales bacterium]|jgi:hypothetical protein|nr:hypothetical protein [Desulfobacteraceae bacterium]MDD3992563.1 hypothetical protein [Desulfobacteraceae bacterium]MDY0312114.1 hypothetical protein [Desulfobacterales bacterium]